MSGFVTCHTCGQPMLAYMRDIFAELGRDPICDTCHAKEKEQFAEQATVDELRPTMERMTEEWGRFLRYNQRINNQVYGYNPMANLVSTAKRILRRGRP